MSLSYIEADNTCVQKKLLKPRLRVESWTCEAEIGQRRSQLGLKASRNPRPGLAEASRPWLLVDKLQKC